LLEPGEGEVKGSPNTDQNTIFQSSLA